MMAQSRMRAYARRSGYMLLRWSVDCSPDHGLKEEQFRLWLSEPLAVMTQPFLGGFGIACAGVFHL